MTPIPGRSAPRRGDVLKAALAWIEDRGDGELPAVADGVVATFGSPAALVCALQSVWRARLAESVALELAGWPPDPVEAVARAWAETAARNPGLRRALDAATASDDPAVAMAMGVATARERVALATAAGVAGRGDSVVAARGAEIQQAARELAPLPLARRSTGQDDTGGRYDGGRPGAGSGTHLGAGRPARRLVGRWPAGPSCVKMAV